MAAGAIRVGMVATIPTADAVAAGDMRDVRTSIGSMRPALRGLVQFQHLLVSVRLRGLPSGLCGAL
jgi:hypothetical protein